jgi:hypothetical protein
MINENKNLESFMKYVNVCVPHVECSEISDHKVRTKEW